MLFSLTHARCSPVMSAPPGRVLQRPGAGRAALRKGLREFPALACVFSALTGCLKGLGCPFLQGKQLALSRVDTHPTPAPWPPSLPLGHQELWGR